MEDGKHYTVNSLYKQSKKKVAILVAIWANEALS